jgi:MFS family permease
MRVKSYNFNVFAASAMNFAVGGIAFWISDYMVNYRGLGNPGRINMIFGGIMVICGIGGTIVGGWLADRKNKTDPGAYMKVSSNSMLGTLVFTLLMMYTPFPYAWGFLGLAIFFLFFNTGSASAIISNVIAPEMRAAAFALSIFFTHALGDVISPFIIGAVADATGGNMNTAFLVVAAAVALSAVLWRMGAPHLEADSKHTTT